MIAIARSEAAISARTNRSISAVGDIQLGADFGGSVDDDLNADAPGEQHVRDRDSLAARASPTGVSAASCSSVTPS